MLELLLVVLAALGVVVGVCVATVVAVVHALVVRNRVVPARRSSASLSWLVSPAGGARLHRRLRAAMAAAHMAVANPRALGLGLVEVVGQLRDRALELDDQLVLAACAPLATRSRMLHELRGEVLEVEQLADRVIRLSGQADARLGLGAVRERLEVLEPALGELDGLEVRLPPAPLRPQA